MKKVIGTVFQQKDGESPQSQVVKYLQEKKITRCIIVGDVATKTIISEGYLPILVIVDGKTKRGSFERIDFIPAVEKIVENQAGRISDLAVETIKDSLDRWLKKGDRTIIRVQGEEDLLTIPVVLGSPLKSAVIYGQPDIGLVLIVVTKKVQHKFQEILKKNFKRIY